MILGRNLNVEKLVSRNDFILWLDLGGLISKCFQGLNDTQNCWIISWFVLFCCCVIWGFAFYFESVSLCSSCWPETHCTTQTASNTVILLTQPSECWDCEPQTCHNPGLGLLSA